MLFEDQIGNKISLKKIPERIVSLVPSQTELLFDLGLDNKILGITNFCILPKNKTKKVSKIGGTKNVNIEKIRNLKPDLIIAGKEENERNQIEELQNDFPVWISDVKDFDTALEMIKSVSEITGKQEAGLEIVNKIVSEKLEFESNKFQKYKALYFIWRKPYMVAGGDTFINSMLELAGFENEAKKLNRYPILYEENSNNFNPEIILLCSEPYRFAEKHIHEFKKLYPLAKTLIVDGQPFTWYGSRMIHAFNYFKKMRDNIKYP